MINALPKLRSYLRCALVLASACFGSGMVQAEPPSQSLEGLQSPVEIITDRYGIAHIYANNQRDLFFAQGYNAASDRLFQFELWRRKALGTLAEIQGEKALAHDRGARLLRYRGDIQQEMAHYHEQGAEIIESFIAGVNAYIRQTERQPELLPFEFQLLGIKPGLWTPEVLVSRHNALTGGMAMEVMLAKTLSALGAEKTRQLLPFARDTAFFQPRSFQLSHITDALMADYRASRSTPAFELADLASPQIDGKKALSQLSQLNQTIDQLFARPLESVNTLGSNNWVIAGERSQSGMPIVANDPHRSLQIPSLRYWVHLNAPGWNVIGGGEPVLPGVSIGHNDFGAWGLTIFPIDQEDIYVYQTNPKQPNQYRYQGQWKTMALEQTTIQVKGQGAVTETLKYTVHGPILFEDRDNHLAFGLKAAWLDKGAAPYLASLRMDQARDWESFREACRYSGLPGENMIWADRQGNIGWQTVGLTPVRFGWSGRLPVPGNGDYEWQGYVPVQAMPHQLNPEQGWIGTANHNNVPQGYPNIFTDWYADPARAHRIDAVLSRQPRHSIDDSKALQYDTQSMTAAALTPLITAQDYPRKLKPAIQQLKAWDHRMDAESAAAAIYHHWEKAMRASLKQRLVPERHQSLIYAIDKTKMLSWLIDPPPFVFADKGKHSRNQLIKNSLITAVATLTEQQGDKVNNWHYGEDHYTQLIHPLSHLVDETLGQTLNSPRLPMGGADNTVHNTSGDPKQLAGASFRMIVDTADWDSTQGTIAPGQSGDPRSAHYQDRFKGWHQGEYFPVYFSRDNIDRVAEKTLKLLPAAPSGAME